MDSIQRANCDRCMHGMALNWSGLIPMASGAQPAPLFQPQKHVQSQTHCLLASGRDRGPLTPGMFLSVLCCLTMAVGLLYQRLIEPHLEWIC